MHEFVDKRVFHMVFAKKSASAKNDSSCFRTESARACIVTRRTDNVRGWNFTSLELEVLHHEHNSWA